MEGQPQQQCDTITITGVILYETDLAIRFSDGGSPVWLPKSQIEIGEPDPKTKLVDIEVPEWLAKKKALI